MKCNQFLGLIDGGYDADWKIFANGDELDFTALENAVPSNHDFVFNYCPMCGTRIEDGKG